LRDDNSNHCLDHIISHRHRKLELGKIIALSYLDTINQSLHTPRAEPNSVAVEPQERAKVVTALPSRPKLTGCRQSRLPAVLDNLLRQAGPDGSQCSACSCPPVGAPSALVSVSTPLLSLASFRLTCRNLSSGSHCHCSHLQSSACLSRVLLCK